MPAPAPPVLPGARPPILPVLPTEVEPVLPGPGPPPELLRLLPGPGLGPTLDAMEPEEQGASMGMKNTKGPGDGGTDSAGCGTVLLIRGWAGLGDQCTPAAAALRALVPAATVGDPGHEPPVEVRGLSPDVICGLKVTAVWPVTGV